jgi:DNA-binding NarL/FixJ family response regulator
MFGYRVATLGVVVVAACTLYAGWGLWLWSCCLTDCAPGRAGRTFRRAIIQLPIIDGYTATRKIKADPALRSIPIIAVTSYALGGEGQKARVAGCDDYVPKPSSPRQLLAKIRQYLS